MKWAFVLPKQGHRKTSGISCGVRIYILVRCVIESLWKSDGDPSYYLCEGVETMRIATKVANECISTSTISVYWIQAALTYRREGYCPVVCSPDDADVTDINDDDDDDDECKRAPRRRESNWEQQGNKLQGIESREPIGTSTCVTCMNKRESLADVATRRLCIHRVINLYRTSFSDVSTNASLTCNYLIFLLLIYPKLYLRYTYRKFRVGVEIWNGQM